jgi:hypothetical protein
VATVDAPRSTRRIAAAAAAAAAAPTPAAAAAAADVGVAAADLVAVVAAADRTRRAVALQVAFERQILKPVFHLIGFRLWV